MDTSKLSKRSKEIYEEVMASRCAHRGQRTRPYMLAECGLSVEQFDAIVKDLNKWDTRPGAMWWTTEHARPRGAVTRVDVECKWTVD